MADLRTAFTGGASGSLMDSGLRQMGAGAYNATVGTLGNLATGGGQLLHGAGQTVAGVVGGTYNAATGATGALAQGGIDVAGRAAGAFGMSGGRRRRRSHRNRKTNRNRKNRKTNRNRKNRRKNRMY
jgi:hypothetical protein